MKFQRLLGQYVHILQMRKEYLLEHIFDKHSTFLHNTKKSAVNSGHMNHMTNHDQWRHANKLIT